MVGDYTIRNLKQNKMEKTLGQKRVKADFNPANNGVVDQIKNKCAKLIDLLETLRTEGSSSEQNRVISIAQTEIESASHFGVKACFTK